MTESEILDGYEDLWRRAALTDSPHWHWRSGIFSRGTCALLIARSGWANNGDGHGLDWHASRTIAPWRCPLGCGATAENMAVAMVHLNDAHDFTWDQFSKFRDLWAQGKR